MSTRTSIRIGTILDSSMKERLPGYERVLEEYTYQYLLFGYRKPILGHYYATVLFQASKTFGGITCEVGLSRTKDFPYYRFYDRPRLGVSGFRARTTHVLKGLEATTTRLYSGPDVLLGHILDLVGEAIQAGNKLIEAAIPRVAEQYELWQPYYEEWEKAEAATTSTDPERRYPDLIGERVARRILHDCLRSGKFDSFLGPRKFRYRDPKFMNCHVYLLARALSFEEPPEPDEVVSPEIDPEQNPDKILFDAIGAISGRSEQAEAIELSPRILERAPDWAFLRSFAALEAFYEQDTVALDQVKSSAKAGGIKQEKKVEPAGVSLDELYSETVSVVSQPAPDLTGAAPDSAAMAARTPKAPPKPKMGKERMDPFETFGDYIEGRIEVQPEDSSDTFDFLGAQLGL